MTMEKTTSKHGLEVKRHGGRFSSTDSPLTCSDLETRRRYSVLEEADRGQLLNKDFGTCWLGVGCLIAVVVLGKCGERK